MKSQKPPNVIKYFQFDPVTHKDKYWKHIFGSFSLLHYLHVIPLNMKEEFEKWSQIVYQNLRWSYACYILGCICDTMLSKITKVHYSIAASIINFIHRLTPLIVFHYILLEYIFYILQLNYIRNYKSYIHTRDHFMWQIILNDIMQYFREKKCSRKLHRRNHDRLN